MRRRSSTGVVEHVENVAVQDNDTTEETKDHENEG